jgi:PTS system galactitol-specific IIA component
MDFEEIIKDYLTFLDESFNSSSEVISFLSRQLEIHGFVNDGFLEAVLERESKFPTGLYLGDINVAIPHTEIKYAKKSGVAIVRLMKPVYFRRMDYPDKEVEVSLVFLLSIVNPGEYVNFLSKLTQSFGDYAVVRQLFLTKSKDEFLKILKDSLCAKEVDK